MTEQFLFAAVLANSERRCAQFKEWLNRSLAQKARYHKAGLRKAVRAAQADMEGGE